MSYIHYKFKSAISHDSLVVDGMGMSAFDFKREVVRSKKLKGEDFELVLTNAESHVEYKDDRSLVPRNSSIIVRRIPVPDAKKRGVIAGTAKYSTDDLHMAVPPLIPNDPASQFQQLNQKQIAPMSNRMDQHMPSMFGSGGGQARGIPGLSSVGIPGIEGFRDAEDLGMSEDERIRAVISEGSSYWQETQDKLGNMKRIPWNNRSTNGGDAGSRNHHFNNGPPGSGSRNLGRPGGYNATGSNRPPPTNYVCHRCGVKGHYIQDCPTNGDTTFDKPKIKRTTGIPRSFLREVDPTNLGSDAQAVMINPDGKVVQFVSNEGEWNRIQSRLAVRMSPEDAPTDEKTAPSDLQCNLCFKLVREAVEISCCRTLYCDSCLRRHLSNAETLGKCPSCSTLASSPDEIVAANTTRRRAAQFIRDRLVRESQAQPSSSPVMDASRSPVPHPSSHQRVSQVNLGGTTLHQRISFRGDPNVSQSTSNKRSSSVVLDSSSDYPVPKRVHNG